MKTRRERADDVRKKLIIRHRVDREDGQEEHLAHQVSLGKDPVTGKYRKSPSRTVHGTKSEAAKALMDYRAELMDPSAIKPSDNTVGDYAARFHEERKHEFRSPLA